MPSPTNDSPIYLDPNPQFGKLRPWDYLAGAYVVVRMLVWELPFFLVTYPLIYQGSPRAFGENAFRFLARTTNGLLNLRLIRSLAGPGAKHARAVLASPRYAPYASNLYQPVSRSGPEGFSGYWIIRSSFSSPSPPSSSDVVIFYLHGGGYVTSRPVSYLIFLLKMAESIIAEGLTVSIFALDYRLAPESIFPTQLEDTNYAWRYLTVDMGIDANNVVLMGDSAGGHLGLSFLVNLWSPLVSLGESRFRFEEVEQTATKRKGPVTKLLIPGGLVMISPWLSLYSRPASYKQNAHCDIITGSLLIDVAARRLLGPSHPDIASHQYHSQYGHMRTLPHIEFLTPDPAINWKEVLPEWVFVAAGQDEVMIDDIRSWASRMEDEPGSVTMFAGDPEDDRKRRARVRLEVERGKYHDWQWLETMDEGKKQDFLMTPVGRNSESKFEGIGRIGRMIVDEIRRRKANRAE